MAIPFPILKSKIVPNSFLKITRKYLKNLDVYNNAIMEELLNLAVISKMSPYRCFRQNIFSSF